MEKKKGYSMFERDKLDPADSMRIERNIYFEEQTADLSGLTALPLEQLQALREEYAAAEQAAFEALQEQAAAWDEQAGKTLAIDKAIEYVRTPEATHTANQWEATDYGKHISNRVYQMRYHISENTRYDREKEKSIPYSWTLSWSIYTNSPHNYGQAKIAGQERKVFADKAAMEKYLKRIAINEGMSELQTLKTAIHEIAHAKLHDIDLNAPKDEQPRVDRRTREVEAESVAYTVCQHYGLDTSDYSFGYVAGWSSGRELSELKSSLETIRSAAAEIINSIDANFAELQKAQDKEQTAGQEQPTREGQEAAPQPEAPKKADTAGKEKPEAAPKEAFTPETIYRVRRNPYSDSRENSHLLQAYVTQENGRAKMGDVLYTGTPEKCRELMGQLKSGELTEGDVKQLYAKAQETAQTTGQDKDTFSIYQIKGGDETRDFRFEPYDRLQAAGNVVDKANYELVYSAPLAPETSLEDIYTRFNIDHPKDFKGHSLSVSDVVVLHQNGQDTAHYVDSVGFRQVPEFLQEQKQLTPDELTTGETIQTPRGTFHVTAMSREQIEAAGYGFHHQSDDGKYLIMGKWKTDRLRLSQRYGSHQSSCL